LLVAASDSPPEQRDMTEKMADVLPNARLVRIGGGHLIDPAGAEGSPLSRKCSRPDSGTRSGARGGQLAAETLRIGPDDHGIGHRNDLVHRQLGDLGVLFDRLRAGRLVDADGANGATVLLET
jgi:hypothetical protein